MGDVIGISTFSISDAGFGLVASASDVLPRVESMIAGEDVSGLGDRKIPFEGRQKSHKYLRIPDEWASETYIINQPLHTDLEITADGINGDVGFLVTDAYGYQPIYADDGYTGTEFGTATTDLDAPYFVDLFSFTPQNLFNSIEANVNLIPFNDLDSDRRIKPGQQVIGNIDYPGDLDRFTLSLTEGDTVNILVDSILIDPFFLITRHDYGDEQIVYDDDTGGGIFGTNAELTFITPDSGIYSLVVQDSIGINIGGYIIDVREPYDDGPTPVAPAPTPIPKMSDFGPMSTFTLPGSVFSMEYPATWSDDPSMLGEMNAFCDQATACFIGESVLMILEEDTSILGGEVSLEEYTDLVINVIEGTAIGMEIIAIEELITEQGLTGNVITVDFQDLAKMKRFVLIHENRAFNATYVITEEEADFLDSMSDYTFGTVTVLE